MMLRAGALVLALGPALALAQVPATRTHNQAFVPVLIFHHVKSDRPGDDAIERGLTVPKSQFGGELSYLRAHRYHTVGASRVVEFLRSGRTLPANPVVLSFDDGYADMYRTVYPMLRRRNMTATFFISPALLGGRRYMSWQQVKEMSRHGMDMEAHSMTHPDLVRVSAGQARGEIVESRRALEQHLGVSVRVFAYPYGSYNGAIVRDVRTAGYWAAFTTHQGWQQRRSDLLMLPRVYVDRDDTLRIFAGRLRGERAALAEDPS